MITEMLLTGAVVVVGLWAGLALGLLAMRPRGVPLREILGLLPDCLHLFRDLARDASLPRGVRLRLWLLLAYVAFPFDLIPDFLPLIGHLDDAIVVWMALRSVLRTAGPEAIGRHWKGGAPGLALLLRLTRP
jgi:uncharacterized membrane protein YkvA (DUF1232 family)